MKKTTILSILILIFLCVSCKTKGVIDLSGLPEDKIYAEAKKITDSPGKYIGSTIKVEGVFKYLFDPSPDYRKAYYCCYIPDPNSRKSTFIEFIPEGYTYPDDFPNIGEKICVIGTLKTYIEGNETFCTLENAKIL